MRDWQPSHMGDMARTASRCQRMNQNSCLKRRLMRFSCMILCCLKTAHPILMLVEGGLSKSRCAHEAKFQVFVGNNDIGL